MVRIVKEREERRLELIETAARLFLEKGYARTSVKDIVDAARVAQGTFYYYFFSKEDVLAAVGLHLMQHLLAEIRSIASSDRSPAAKLNAIVNHIFSTRDGGRSLHVHEDEVRHTLLHDRMVRAGQEDLRNIFTKIIKEGTELAQFNVTHPEETAEFLIFGLAELEHRSAGFRDNQAARAAGAALEEILSRVLAVDGYEFDIKMA